ncbi:MAG: histidine phosphatase family protein [Pseudomonadota bacterium]
MLRPVLVLALALLCPLLARADESVLALLAEPRTHAVMRHALAPGSSDPEDFDLNDCAKQRNLSDLGRAQARRAGDMMRRAGIRVDRLLTSQYCRCRETAEIMDIGPVVEEPILNSFSNQSWKGTGQTEALRALLAELPDGETAFLVTHNVNAEALTGDRPISGEIQVIRVDERGRVTLLGSVEVPLGF